MLIFKTTKNILKFTDEDELYDPNWMDSNKVILPPSIEWDYKREMKIEDVDIWQVLYQSGGGIGIYAAWNPFAEFYMITSGWDYLAKTFVIETYYGKDAAKNVFYKAKKMGINLQVSKVWIDEVKC